MDGIYFPNLTVIENKKRLNVRVAGIIEQNGHLLAVKETGEDAYYLPGGRVQLGEQTGDAIFREMEEELGKPVGSAELVYVAESFFDRFDARYHEYGFYYRVEVPDWVPFHPEDCVLTGVDDGVELDFRWIKQDLGDFTRKNLYPIKMREHLLEIPNQVTHIVTR